MTTAIELLVTDVDGTLVRSDRTLAASTRDAVASLRRAGIVLALVSARATAGLDALVGALALDGPRAAFNGAVILNGAGTVLAEHVLAPETVAATLAVLDAQALDAWVFARGAWFLRDPTGAYVRSEQRSISMRWTVVGDFDALHDGVHKIMGSSADAGRMARAERALAADPAVVASVLRSQPYYLDVTHRAANKGAATRFIAASLGVKRAAVAAVGDMANDLPMFAEVGLRVAMGNAPPEVRAAADRVVGGNDEDGWAEAANLVLRRRWAA